MNILNKLQGTNDQLPPKIGLKKSIHVQGVMQMDTQANNTQLLDTEASGQQFIEVMIWYMMLSGVYQSIWEVICASEWKMERQTIF